MNISRKYEWLLTVLQKVSLFLAISSIVTVFYYIIGNFQDFLDSTQIILLRLIEIITLAGFIIELYLLVMLIVIAVKDKRMFAFRFVSTVVLFGYFLGIYIIIKFVSSWIHL
jgi:hypothetical protein